MPSLCASGWGAPLGKLLNGGDGIKTCGILAQGFRIDRILIPPRYTFFFRSPTANNSEVKRAWPGVISGWVTDREVFSGAHK
jgi:hypothetical protein